MRLDRVLTLLIGVHLIFLLFYFPAWVSFSCGTLLITRLMMFRFWPKLQVPRQILNVLSALVVIPIWIENQTLVGPEASGSLIMLLSTLKIFDLRASRDYRFVLFVALALLALIVLQDQSLGITLFMVCDIIIVFGLFARIEEHKLSLGANSVKMVLKAMLQTFPIWGLIFFFFPRTGVPWGMAPNLRKAKTGISDDLAPGSVEQLVNTQEIVFRATLDLPLPPEELYWRGLVLDQSNGLRWTRSNRPVRLGDIKDEEHAAGPPVAKADQEILLEPQDNRWIYALDTPDQITPLQGLAWNRLSLNNQMTVELSRAPVAGFLYKASSILKPKSYQISDEEKIVYTQLPKRIEPEVYDLSAKIFAKAQNTGQKVIRLLNFFSKDFYYTLRPGTLEGDELKSFLLVSKRGFCGHFAASFATLLRMEGIPARLVVGFQGAQKNPLNDSLVVRQSNAHVWVEYFDDVESRWRRVDPTSVVAPLRLELGAEFYSLTPEELKEQNLLNYFDKRATWRKWLDTSKFFWDSISYGWQRFLFSYDFETQRKLQDRIVDYVAENHRQVLYFSMLAVAIFGFFLTRWWRLRRLNPAQRIEAEVYEFFKKMDLEPKSWEGERSFFARIAKTFPHNQEFLMSFSEQLIELKYSAKTQDQQMILGAKGRALKLMGLKWDRRSRVSNAAL